MVQKAAAGDGSGHHYGRGRRAGRRPWRGDGLDHQLNTSSAARDPRGGNAEPRYDGRASHTGVVTPVSPSDLPDLREPSRTRTRTLTDTDPARNFAVLTGVNAGLNATIKKWRGGVDDVKTA
eukprot:scaffold501952_cov43-Prasinocladus_malaysianus.AAC.1